MHHILKIWLSHRKKTRCYIHLDCSVKFWVKWKFHIRTRVYKTFDFFGSFTGVNALVSGHVLVVGQSCIFYKRKSTTNYKYEK